MGVVGVEPLTYAAGETRTLKGLRPQHFECCVFTNFTTAALFYPTKIALLGQDKGSIELFFGLK